MEGKTGCLLLIPDNSPKSFGNAANPPAKTGFLGTCPKCGDISLPLKFNTDSPMGGEY